MLLKPINIIIKANYDVTTSVFFYLMVLIQDYINMDSLF